MTADDLRDLVHAVFGTPATPATPEPAPTRRPGYVPAEGHTMPTPRPAPTPHEVWLNSLGRVFLDAQPGDVITESVVSPGRTAITRHPTR